MWCAQTVRIRYDGELEARLTAFGLEKDPHGTYVRNDDWNGGGRRRIIVAVYPLEKIARAYVLGNCEEMTNSTMTTLMSHIGKAAGTETDVVLRETTAKLLLRCMEKFASET